jgi:hypothetical protein
MNVRGVILGSMILAVAVAMACSQKNSLSRSQKTQPQVGKLFSQPKVVKEFNSREVYTYGCAKPGVAKPEFQINCRLKTGAVLNQISLIDFGGNTEEKSSAIQVNENRGTRLDLVIRSRVGQSTDDLLTRKVCVQNHVYHWG